MAQLPRYIAKEQQGGGALPKWQPAQARRPWMAMAEGGEALTELGKAQVKIQKAQDEARRQIKLSEMKMATLKMLAKTENNEDVLAADSKNHVEVLNNKILEGRAKIAEMTDDTLVLGAWNEWMNLQEGQTVAQGYTVAL